MPQHNKNTDQQSKEQLQTEKEVTSPQSAEPTSSSRPRRNARKSVLYNSEQYDLQHTGQSKGEPEERPKSAKPSASNEADSSSTTSRKHGLEPDMLKGSKRRKIPPKLAEEFDESLKNASRNDTSTTSIGDQLLTDGSNMVVAAELELPHNDDGPPVLGPSDGYHDDLEPYRGSDEESNMGDNSNPPDLERNPPTKKRGRPRRSAPQPSAEEGSAVKIKLSRPSARTARAPENDGTTKRAPNANQRNVKLFQEELETTPQGESYATVVNGCLTELLRKDRIIDLLTNPDEIELIKQAGWFLSKPPRLPPLTTEKACYAFYVDGSGIRNAKDLSFDDLRPWSSTLDPSIPNSLNIKPNVRRHPVARLSGKLTLVRHETNLAEYHLTEYSARLPREQRLRKKIFYLTRDNQIYGNVLILYDYVNPGNAPVQVTLPHGNDHLRVAALVGAENEIEDDHPFEQQLIEGPRGGFYLKLRLSKLGWAHNKKQLLDYLFNKPELLAETDALNDRLPDLPPLIGGVGVFAYFVPAGNIVNQIHHAADGLSPWTSNPSEEVQSVPRVRSTRKVLVQEGNGNLLIARDQKAPSSLCLVETMSTLARCKRIRKRVFYVHQNNSIIVGNVCYIYEFLQDGPLPTLYPPMDAKQYAVGTKWTNRTSKPVEMQSYVMNTTNSFEEEILEPVDEEGIVDVIDVHQEVHEQNCATEDNYLDAMRNAGVYEDTLNDGYDPEFNDDPIEKAEVSDPYYDLPRRLSTGHVYMTVRHKKVATSFDNVLQWIANTNIVSDREILNETKPTHPPLVTNSRAYAFFVAGTAIFPHDINRDDFSPWSHNGNAENPICYRTKVRKLGVYCEPRSSEFFLKDKDYKTCPYHLVYLYSINPKEPRMRKKIYYVMETQSKMVVSHALIIYDYNTEGNIPKLNSGQYKPLPKKNFARITAPHHDIYNDVSDNEEDRDCPFMLPPETAVDGTLYLQLSEPEFWNDRNRQLQFLVNHPNLVEEMGCLNVKVPDLPPSYSGKGTFIFFINGEEINFRTLTADKLAPWSENVCNNPTGVTKRPKSSKTPLGVNRNGQLRIYKTSGTLPQERFEYQLHVYSAILPRCPRLRKKVVYVQRDGRQYGHGLIMYCYTEPGESPQPLQKVNPPVEEFFNSLEPAIREDVIHLIKTMSPVEVSKVIQQEHGVHLSVNAIYNMKHKEVRVAQLQKDCYVQDWNEADGAGPAPLLKTRQTDSRLGIREMRPAGMGEVRMEKTMLAHDMMTEEDMVVEHTEVIEQGMSFDQDVVRSRNPFLEKNATTTGFVRGSQRHDALWRILQERFGTESMTDTFDELFKLLYEKNEGLLLHMINTTFNVEIYPTDAAMETEVVEEDSVHFPRGPNDPELSQQIPRGQH